RQALAQRVERCQRGGRVRKLVAAAQGRVREAVAGSTGPEVAPLICLRNVAKLAAQAQQVRVDRTRVLDEGGRRIAVGADGSPPGAEDSRLLARDVLPRRSEVVGMVDRD